MLSTMENLITQFRALQFLAHRVHNKVKGSTFGEDHEFFGELYPAYETAYDSLVERMIGLEKPLNINKVNKAAAEMSSVAPNFLKILLKGEEDLCSMIAKENPKATLGTQNLLQQLCDDSEARQYQIKQRL
jgi:DNA-binding ferritin-like protein